LRRRESRGCTTIDLMITQYAAVRATAAGV
jgi:hypothetical protein